MTNPRWKPSSRKFGVVISRFTSNTQHSLPLEIGETVHIFEEYLREDGTATWYLGCSFGNKNKKGIFPCNHIYTKDCKVENEGPYETVTPVEDAVVKELTFVLREWLERWKSLFVNRKMSLYHSIRLVMAELAKHRSTLVSDTLTKEQALELKQQVVTMIDWGNGNLDMDLVPRVEYQQADPERVSVVEMYRIHQMSVENCEGAWMHEAEPGGKVTVKKKHEAQGEVMHHLLVEFISFACSVSDCAEVLISLYDETENRFLSEKFVIHLDKEGKSMGNSSSISPSTLFTDLSLDDTQRDIYLVIQILRKGRLLLENNVKKMPSHSFRRPWGVSVLCLRDLFQIRPENGMEYFLRVQCVDNESQFSTKHEDLIKRQVQLIGRGGNTDKQNQGIMLSIKLVCGELKNAKIDHPMLINKGMIVTSRLGFSDFVNPGEVRNDLYLTLSGAEFERGNKTASKNVEVQVTVYNSQYEMIDGCISSASGTPITSHFFSSVFYHNNSPRWNETIRLSIPIERFNASHIRLELSHCSSQDKQSKKLFGFAFLNLTTSGDITRQDGSYELCIYKVEDVNKIKNYLNLPSLHDDFNDPKMIPSIPDNLPFSRSNKEYVTVKTFLCSSKFAQKSELLAVLQWTSLPSATIHTSLENLVTVKGQELVRYLQDVLDALFNMFNAGNGSRVSFALNIFQALIHIFNLLQEEMFDKFACVLEDYLEKSFSSPVAHRDMMYCLQETVEQIYTCTDFDEKNETKRVFKVLEDIFKFSVKSCMLSQRMGGDQLTREFIESLNEVFKTFGKVLQSSEQILNKAQLQLLTNIHKCFTPLLHIISPEDLAKLVIYLLNIVGKDVSSNILRGKTQLIKNTINSPLLTDATSRNLLLPLCIAHLKKCFIQQRHLAISSNTFGDLLSCIFYLKQTRDVQEDITKIVQGMFDVTIRLLWNLTKEQANEVGTRGVLEVITDIAQGMFDVTLRFLWNLTKEETTEFRSLLISCLMEMLRLMDDHHYQKLISDYPKPNPLKNSVGSGVIPHTSSSPSKDFLNRVLLVFKQLVSSDFFPNDWTSLRMMTNNIMLTSIQYIAADLADNFLKGEEFDRELWTNFFLLAVSFITQPALQLEQYSEAKSGQIKDRYTDMRVPVGCQIYSLWNQLGPNSHLLFMDLIGPFLRVSMIPETELRKATIPIFYDIMQCEFDKNAGDLRRMEGKMIYELDFLVLEHHGNAAFKDLFESMLLDKLQSEPEMQEEGKRFVFSVTDLLERLLDYRAIMDREEQRDTKMHCTFNILNFYKDSREDMYIRYISRLYELHYTASNYVEAGLTLRLYAQLLTWSDKMLPAEMTYITQTEMERKEALFMMIIDCFDKGKSWEYGIPLCKELAEHYEKTFQYKKLGQILQRQASFFYQILEGSKLRQDPTYYRVVYYGNSFPPYLKNKAFIYRGDECLKLATIMNQLKTEYPNANILPSNSPPDDSYKNGDAQYIQIISVKPVPSQHSMFEGKTVPSEISSFYACNEIDTFQFDRPYYRGDKDKQNEFKTLCLERTVTKTSYKLPGILRWYEVVNTQLIQLSPVQTAIDTVQQMNAELRSSTQKAVSNPDQHLRHLVMRLQGVISGAVNGGIPKYQEAFFNEEYTSKFPTEMEYIEELKAVIMEQIQLLERGLKVNGKYASPEMQPLHKSLLESFEMIKSSMGIQATQSNIKSRGSSIVSLPSSNRPSTPSSTSLNSSGSNRSSVVSGDIQVIQEDNLYNELDTYTQQKETTSFHLTQSLPPPPPYPKKRSTSLRGTSFSGTSSFLTSLCGSLPCSNEAGVSFFLTAPSPSDSRPRSANLTRPKYNQLPLPNTRAGSQPCLFSNNNTDEKDDVPPLLPSRKKSISDVPSGLSPSVPSRASTAVSSAAPPIPRRETIAKMPGGLENSVIRSKSSSESETTHAPPRPPRSHLSNTATSAVSPSSNTPAIPPLPAKRSISTSSSPLSSSVLHGSSSSLNSPLSPGNSMTFSPSGYNSSTYSSPPPVYDEIASQMATNKDTPISKLQKPPVPKKLSLKQPKPLGNGESPSASPGLSAIQPPPRTPSRSSSSISTSESTPTQTPTPTPTPTCTPPPNPTPAPDTNEPPPLPKRKVMTKM